MMHNKMEMRTGWMAVNLPTAVKVRPITTLMKTGSRLQAQASGMTYPRHQEATAWSTGT